MFRRKVEKQVTDVDVYQTLPRNRKELFFDLVKHRKMTMLTLSFFTFMFFIPLAVDLFAFTFLLHGVDMSTETGIQTYFSLIFYSMIIMLPCMLIGFLGLSGAFYAAKKLVWQEGVMISYDFFKGIKENWKHGLVNGAIFGLILFGFVVGGCYLLIHVDLPPILRGIGFGGLILLMLTFGMIIPLNFTQGVYYQNSYLRTFKNSFSFMGLLNWRVFLTFLFSTGAVIAACCLINIISVGVGLFLFALLNGWVIVIYTLISHSAFDKFINTEHYPDMVGKGLYKDNKEA